MLEEKEKIEYSFTDLEIENVLVTTMLANMKAIDAITPQLEKHGPKQKDQVNHDFVFLSLSMSISTNFPHQCGINLIRITYALLDCLLTTYCHVNLI